MKRLMGIVALALFATNSFANDSHGAKPKQGETQAPKDAHSNIPPKVSNGHNEKLVVHHELHWAYDGEYDPIHWGDISGNETCKTGKLQSPINITPKVIGKNDSRLITFEYAPTSGNVINNGHTIQANLDSGSMIKVGGKTYNLLQFHFHTPSEERFDGKTYPMVAHMVHKSADGELAVVAILFKIGKENLQLRQMFNSFPKTPNDKISLSQIDIPNLLPEYRTYYGFTGSLTTPPCTEGVKWHVLKHPVEISSQQYSMFRGIYLMNARPAQPVNEREIFISE